MQKSEIVIHERGGASFVGPDAVNLYRAVMLRQALVMYACSKMLMTRGATPTFMLAEATKYTGHKYKRGAYTEAAKDMADWIATMKAAMPVTDERSSEAGEQA